jgi:hypothetical protein
VTDIEKRGLVPGHAYTIKDLFQGVEITRKGVKQKVDLIKLRNPWGAFEWNGEFGDKDPVWTPQLRELLQQ